MFGRSLGDLVLLGVTLVELALLVQLTPSFTLTDWIYVLQHLLVLGVALTRRAPERQDRSQLSNASIVVEERILAHDPGWAGYAARVRSRLIPGIW